ncbi:hypothetical protein ACQ4PT_034288 [Festuca glaucescens]
MEARLLVIGGAVVGLLAVGGVVLLFRRAAAVLAGGGVVLLSRRAAAASAGGAVGRDFLGSSVLLQDRQPYMECTPLKDLSRNSYRWKVMVRVARIWEFRSSDQSTLFSLEFIVVDQQKSMMEGVVPGNRVDQFKDQLKEGSVYTIDKFDLYDPKKTYRSVDSPFRICFTMRTLLAEGERYKISVKITEVLSEDGWYYMSCTACWKKLTLEDGVYMCPNCSTVVPLPRHRFVARAIDTDIADIQSAKSANLYFFGPRGDAIVGKDASALVSSTRGQSSSVPPELLAIVGKEYNVVVTPRPDKNDENSTVPQVPEQIETAGQASTPPPSTDLTPSKVASSGSAVDKVPSSSSGRGKRKNSGSTTSPKSKKTLQFLGND